MLASLGPGPLHFLFLQLCPLGFLSCAQPIRGLEVHFLPLQGFDHDELDLHWSLQVFAPSWLPHLGALHLVALPSLALSLLCWTPLGLFHLRVDHPGLGRIWAASEGFCHSRGETTFGDKVPFRASPCNVPSAYSKPGLFNPWGFTAHALPQDACFVGAWLQQFLLQGLCPTGHISPVLATRPFHPYNSIGLVATLLQE
jgi:hypothetical protein